MLAADSNAATPSPASQATAAVASAVKATRKAATKGRAAVKPAAKIKKASPSRGPKKAARPARGKRGGAASKTAAVGAGDVKAVLAAIEQKYTARADKEALEVVTTRIPRSLYQALRAKADSLGISMNQLVHDVLQLTFPNAGQKA